MVLKSKVEKGITVPPSTKSNGVHLDTILEEVGMMGRYQVTILLLAAVPIIFSALAAGEYVFTTARIPTRCLIPECDGQSPEFSPPWKENAIPMTSSGYDNCARYANSSDTPVVRFCPASFFDQNRTESCQEYVYANTHSVVFDFGLACEEWKRSLIGSVRSLGSLVAVLITGHISDRWGRRFALVINAVNTAWIGLVRSFVNSYELFVILEVVEAFLGVGAFSSTYILVTELVGPKYRVIASASIFTQFACGQMLLGLIAWGVPQWRSLTRVLYAPQIIMISYFWIMTESVRWLMSKGRFEESKEILIKVAKMNKKELSDKSLEAFALSATEQLGTAKEGEQSSKWLVIEVIKSKVLLMRVCISPVWWITNGLIYCGLSINAVNLVGNSYLNYIAVAAVEIPGYWTAILLLNRVGRKPVLICGYWLCAVCQFTFAFLPEGYDGLSISVYLVGKYCIAIVLTSTYLYTAELYPTKYRQRLFAFSSAIGRLGHMAAPLTPSLATEIWGPLPSVIFGSTALLSGLLVFPAPETLGIELPDTIKDVEQIKH